MSIKAIDWVTNWSGFIGYLSGAQASAWLEVISANVEGVRQSEIDNAVAKICSVPRNKEDAKPDVRTIIKTINAMRGNSPGYMAQVVKTPNTVSYYDSAGHYCKTTMSDLKQFLNRRPPTDEAWEIICTPLNFDQCRELQTYCDNNRIGYARFVPNIEETISAVSKAITALPA